MKSVLITGTSKGIGLETALAFGQAGYKVFATLRNPSTASALKQFISEKKLPISISVMNVDSDESVKQGMDAILQEHGPVDVLVNNAGIEYHASVEEMDMKEIKAIMETNYFGPIRCIKTLLPHMRERRSGCIINVTSVAGKISCTPLGAYSASKFALESISEALAQELKPFNVKVKIVEPGIIDTSMARNITVGGSEVYQQTRRFAGLFRASLKTPTHPSLVAEAIVGVAESDNWQLRYPVGPDAQPFLDWRASMNNEEWVEWNAMKDDEWYNAVETSFGLNARPVSSVSV